MKNKKKKQNMIKTGIIKNKKKPKSNIFDQIE